MSGHATSEAEAPAETGVEALFTAGDAADLTLARSSQGRIKLEIRTKHGLLELGLNEGGLVSLIFGQAHVAASVTRYLPKRVTLASADQALPDLSGWEMTSADPDTWETSPRQGVAYVVIYDAVQGWSAYYTVGVNYKRSHAVRGLPFANMAEAKATCSRHWYGELSQSI